MWVPSPSTHPTQWIPTQLEALPSPVTCTKYNVHTSVHVRRFTFWSQIHFAVLSITFLALLECLLLMNTTPKSHAAKPNIGANSSSFLATNAVLSGVASSKTNISNELWWFATIMKFFPLRVLKISIPSTSEHILNSLTRDLYTKPAQRWKFSTSNGWNTPTKMQYIAKNIIKQWKLKYFVRNRKLFDFLYRAMNATTRPRRPNSTNTRHFNCHIMFWRWFLVRSYLCERPVNVQKHPRMQWFVEIPEVLALLLPI